MDVSKSAANFFAKAKKVEKPFLHVPKGIARELTTTGNPSQPAFNAGSLPTYPTQAQTQSEQHTDTTAGTPGAGRKRFQLMEMMQPEPTRDTANEELIKKRARINALGRGIGALGQLAGVASGGDASYIPDGQNPFLMKEFEKLDLDYRNKLQDWTQRGFQVDQFNSKIQNDAVQDQARLEDNLDVVNLKSQNDAILNQQKAEYAMQALLAKSQEEQAKEMRKVGVNPDDPKAMEKYLAANGLAFTTEIKRKQAQANWNNRIASGAGRSGLEKQVFDLPTLQRGKQAMLDQIDAQIQELSKATSSYGVNPNSEQVKALLDQKKQLQQYNPGKNPLIDAEVMRMGSEGQSKGYNQPDLEHEADPDWYGANQPVIKNVKAHESIQKGIQTVLSPSFSQLGEDQQIQIFDTIIKGMVANGDAATEEEAEQILQEFLSENQQGN